MEILKEAYKANFSLQLMDDVYFVDMADDAAFAILDRPHTRITQDRTPS